MIKLLLVFLFSFSIFAQTATYPPDDGEYSHYITKAGDTISVGDKIQLGIPLGGATFIFISQDSQYVRSRLAGDIVTISKLETRTNNKTSYKMHAFIKGYGMVPILIDLENALKVEEIILLNQ